MPVSPREEHYAGGFLVMRPHVPSGSVLLFWLGAANNVSVERGKGSRLLRCRPVPASESMEHRFFPVKRHMGPGAGGKIAADWWWAVSSQKN